MRRAGLVVLLAGALCAPASQALAHAFMRRSSPAVGAHVAVPPRELRMTFTEPVDVKQTEVKLKNSAGAAFKLGPLAVSPDDASTFVAPILTPLRSGRYHVEWHAISAVEGHRTDGGFTFTVTGG